MLLATKSLLKAESHSHHQLSNLTNMFEARTNLQVCVIEHQSKQLNKKITPNFNQIETKIREKSRYGFHSLEHKSRDLSSWALQDREIWGFAEKREKEEEEEEGRGVSASSREGRGGVSARFGEGRGRCEGGEDGGGGGRRGVERTGRWKTTRGGGGRCG